MPERPILTALLLVMGLICLLVGLAFAVPGSEPSQPATAVGFLGFGLFCLCAVFLFATGFTYPARMLFDNARGWLCLLDRRGALQGAVPFDGIAGISVQRSVAGGIVRSSAGIDLERGGRWELYASRSRAGVESFAEKLSGGLRLSAVDLSFTFTRMERAISLPKPEEIEQYSRYRQGTFGPADTPAMPGFLRGLARIDVSALAPGERLGLEEAIRTAVASPALRG